MLRRFLAVLLALLPAVAAAEQQKATFVSVYDLDATTTTYCVTTGQGGTAFGAPMPAPAPVSTSGSSTTVTATTASTAPFAQVSVGDILFFRQSGGSTITRYVTARASSDSITINSATTLTAAYFTWMKRTCGTAATDGWISVAEWKTKKLTFRLEQVNVTGGISVVWECRDATYDTQPVRIYPNEGDGCGVGGTYSSGFCNFTTAGIDSRLSIITEAPWDACRIGFKIGSADDGGDLTTNAEQITASVHVER